LSVKSLRVLTKLRNHVERWVQEVLAVTVKDGIVLLDGSLTAGTPDNPSSRVQRILSTARKNNSIVIALSKSTQLTVGGKNILGFFDAEKIPHIIDITSVVKNEYPAYPIRFLGRVCVSKLSPDGFLFRTDIDKDTDEQQALVALGRIAGTDVIFHGYPETLRIAHIFSTFTANEILAVQRFIAFNHHVSLQARPNLLRSLFRACGPAEHFEPSGRLERYEIGCLQDPRDNRAGRESFAQLFLVAIADIIKDSTLPGQPTDNERWKNASQARTQRWRTNQRGRQRTRRRCKHNHGKKTYGQVSHGEPTFV